MRMTLHCAEDTDSCVCVCEPLTSLSWLDSCDQWDDILKMLDPVLKEVHNLPVLVLKEHTHLYKSVSYCRLQCKMLSAVL